MHRIVASLAAAAFIGSAAASASNAAPPDRRATLALIEQDLLREDSRVFTNRERASTIESALEIGARRYRFALQRPQHHEYLLVLETRDGARCPGVQTIIVGTRSGRLYQGVCQSRIALDLRADRAYFEAELERLLALFHPLLAPYSALRRENG
jgi:hypothetical protein